VHRIGGSGKSSNQKVNALLWEREDGERRKERSMGRKGSLPPLCTEGKGKETGEENMTGKEYQEKKVRSVLKESETGKTQAL